MGHFLITGAAGGIGAAVAARLRELDHSVTGVVRPAAGGVRRGPQSSAPSAVLSPPGPLLQADLARPEELGAALAGFLANLRSLDGIVHCAGIVRPGSLADCAAADFTDQFAVNVTAVAELTRLCLPALLASRGTVVMLNSGSGLNARSPLAAYGASKFALRAFADALRQEQPLLRVCSVYPGRTATGMQRLVRAAERGDYVESDYMSPATVAEVVCAALLLPADAVLTDVTVRPVGGSAARSGVV